VDASGPTPSPIKLNYQFENQRYECEIGGARAYDTAYTCQTQAIGALTSGKSREYTKFDGLQCVGTEDDVWTNADGSRGMLGSIDECKAKCDELDCIGFVYPTTGGGAGKCFLRGGTMGEPKEHTYNDGRDCYIPVEVASTSIQINIRGNDDVCISGIIVNSIEIKVKPQRLGDNVNSVHGPDTSEGIEKVYKRRYTMSTYGNAIMTLPDGFDSMNGVYQIKGSTYRMPFGSSDVTTMDSALDGIEFDEVVDGIGWVKIFYCEEARSESSNKAMSFFHYDNDKDERRLNLQKAAISIKIVPEGSTKNPKYDEYAVEAKPMSNPVRAVNNNLEPSYVLDDDLERSDFANLDNWIGTDAAKARLSNSCGKNGNVESFEDKPYFACGNSRGLHIKKDGICRFDFGGDVGQNIEIYLGYYLPQCYVALTSCVGCLDNPHEHPDDLLPVSCNENAYKTGDEYKFRLVYDDGETSDKTWTQTSWLMEPEIKGSSLGEFGDVNSLNYFVGLGMSSSHTATFLDGNAKQGETWWGAAGVIKLQQGGIPAISQDGGAGPIAQSVQLFMCYGECDEDTETVKCSMDENDEFLNCPVERREFGFIKTGYCAEFGMWQLNQWQCAKAISGSVQKLQNIMQMLIIMSLITTYSIPV